MTFFSHLHLNFYLHNWIIGCPRLDVRGRRTSGTGGWGHSARRCKVGKVRQDKKGISLWKVISLPCRHRTCQLPRQTSCRRCSI